MRDRDFAALSELDDYHLVNEDQDVRGRPLVTPKGEKLGIIQRMLVDKREERVAALVLEDGRAFPVEEVEIRGGKVVIDSGVQPRAAPPRQAGAQEMRVPIVEEEVAIGKREVERGRIRVRSRVVETPIHEEVRLREEHVDIERRPVNQPVEDADRLLQERSFEVSETAEEAVVGKRAVVKEEVVVRKEGEERVEQIDDTVRRTEVDVDRAPGRTSRDKDRRHT